MADVLSRDIAVLKTYGAAPYANALKKLEKDIKEKQASVNEKIGVKVIIDPAMLTLWALGSSRPFRNPTPVSHHHTFGMLRPTDNGWPKSSHCRSLAAPRLFRMRRTRTRANMSST